MNRSALDSDRQFPQFPDREFRVALYDRDVRSHKLSFLCCNLDRAQQRRFDGPSHEPFNPRNQVVADAIPSHSPA